MGGGAVLLGALIIFLPAVGRARTPHRWYLAAYRLLVVVLAVSVPVGLTLSVLRHA